MSTTITEEKLKSLVKNIVTQLVKEYSMLDNPPSSLNGNPQDMANAQITDPNNQLAGAMSVSDQQKLKRIKDKQSRDQIKQKQLELDTVKKKLDYTKKDQDQMKRTQIPSLQKSIQQLKTQH